MTRYLTYEHLVDYNNRYGGGQGVIDESGLRSAADRPRSGFGEVEAFPSIWEKAAALLHGLCTRQCFVDGNKRTAWLATVAFLRLNMCPLGPVPVDEAEHFVLRIVANDAKVMEVARWLRVRADPVADDAAARQADRDGMIAARIRLHFPPTEQVPATLRLGNEYKNRMTSEDVRPRYVLETFERPDSLTGFMIDTVPFWFAHREVREGEGVLAVAQQVPGSSPWISSAWRVFGSASDGDATDIFGRFVEDFGIDHIRVAGTDRGHFVPFAIVPKTRGTEALQIPMTKKATVHAFAVVVGSEMQLSVIYAIDDARYYDRVRAQRRRG